MSIDPIPSQTWFAHSSLYVNADQQTVGILLVIVQKECTLLEFLKI